MASNPLRRLGSSIRKRVMGIRVGKKWESDTKESSLKKRVYDNYETYLAHQKLKLTHRDVSKHDLKFRHILRARLASLPCDWRNMKVLCLGARTGAEVRAFHDIGAFAIGIDVNPGKENPHVLYGDFHDLQFPDAIVDAVYTNSLDHAFEMDRLLAEVKRVLKPGGHFLVEAAMGEDRGMEPRFYEASWWASTDDLLELIKKSGFELDSRKTFDTPWDGEQFLLKRV